MAKAWDEGDYYEDDFVENHKGNRKLVLWAHFVERVGKKMRWDGEDGVEDVDWEAYGRSSGIEESDGEEVDWDGYGKSGGITEPDSQEAGIGPNISMTDRVERSVDVEAETVRSFTTDGHGHRGVSRAASEPLQSISDTDQSDSNNDVDIDESRTGVSHRDHRDPRAGSEPPRRTCYNGLTNQAALPDQPRERNLSGVTQPVPFNAPTDLDLPPPYEERASDTHRRIQTLDYKASRRILETGVIIGRACAERCKDPKRRPLVRAIVAKSGHLYAYTSRHHCTGAGNRPEHYGDMQIGIADIELVPKFARLHRKYGVRAMRDAVLRMGK